MRQACGTSEAARIADEWTVYDSQDPSPHAETCDSCPNSTVLVPGTHDCGCMVGFELANILQFGGLGEGGEMLYSRSIAGVENYGHNCWDECGSQQGPCSFCGTGLCCAYDFPFDTSNGCSGSVGIPGITHHVCSYPPPPSMCQSCGAGKYSASIGGDPCAPCSAGKYSPGPGASACWDCE